MSEGGGRGGRLPSATLRKVREEEEGDIIAQTLRKVKKEEEGDLLAQRCERRERRRR
jgi:hypothetical protein